MELAWWQFLLTAIGLCAVVGGAVAVLKSQATKEQITLLKDALVTEREERVELAERCQRDTDELRAEIERLAAPRREREP